MQPKKKSIRKVVLTELSYPEGVCPTQWHGLSGEKLVYIRYRWGNLTASVDNELVAEKPFGDRYCGMLEDDDMLELLGEVFDFTAVR